MSMTNRLNSRLLKIEMKDNVDNAYNSSFLEQYNSNDD